MFKIFSKKDSRIAELEKENERLKEDKEGILKLYNTTIKNHEQLEHEHRSLKAGSDALKKVAKDNENEIEKLKNSEKKLDGALTLSIEREIEKEKKIEKLKNQLKEMENKNVKRLELENEYIQNEYTHKRLESIVGLFKDIDIEFIKDFRKARGKALNASNKRIRCKELNKMATSMEAVFKVLEEVE